MSLIKFPTQIKPSRVTVNLERRDEMFVSPATGIQQVASRGNAFWRWTYEFKDISLSERETVQAFLAKCRGSLNTFKVSDPANYEIRGSVSDWVDLYGNRSANLSKVGSSTSKINSYFRAPTQLATHVTDDDMVHFEWEIYISVGGTFQYNQVTALNASLELGKAYVQRVKFFQHPDRAATRTSFRVGSGTDTYIIQASPRVNSTGVITAPFYPGDDSDSYNINIVNWSNITGNPATAGHKGDHFYLSDYRLARCALVANSENLLTYSHEFDNAVWVTSNMNVGSGYGELGPTGVNSYAWALIPDTSVNTTHQIGTSITKINTEDMYTFSFYAKPVEASSHYAVNVRMSDTLATFPQGRYVTVFFDVAQGVSQDPYSLNVVNQFYNPHAAIYDVGSGWKRCVLRAVSNSNSTLSVHIAVASASSLPFTGTNSPSFLVRDMQITRHPFAGPYMPTTDTAVVGTNWQTGSNLVVDGLDPNDKIKAGTRIEIVNQFANAGSGTYERSEFKKITEEVVVAPEGWAILPIDPPIRNAPETMRMSGEQGNFGDTMHNPVIFSNPELTARLLGGTVQYIEKPLQLTDVVFEVIEDLSE
jgi:hypothetical protein